MAWEVARGLFGISCRTSVGAGVGVAVGLGVGVSVGGRVGRGVDVGVAVKVGVGVIVPTNAVTKKDWLGSAVIKIMANMAGIRMTSPMVALTSAGKPLMNSSGFCSWRIKQYRP